MPKNFETSSRLTDGKYFVIEADEYDTAFFDKRSKFIHYLPNTLVINNIEFDHADIFENLKAIKKQFHHLVRTIASKDCIVFCNQKNVNQVLDMGTYSNKFSFGKSPSDDMQIYKSTLANKTTQKFKIKQKEKNYTVLLPMLGDHNKFNSVAAISACLQIGVSIDKSISALALFEGAKRRQEVFLNKNNIEFIEDFAHHPTAIKQTALAFKKTLQQDAKLIAVIDPRSNTMKKGILKNSLLKSISIPDLTILYQHKDLPWKYDNLPKNIILANSIEKIISLIKENAKPNDIVVTMSNGSFDGIKNKIIQSYK
jgi:UDP-N-acetylmuramate: L-alanyl-gamma-D-glutamyl-meso-diaminopimelate ligase